MQRLTRIMTAVSIPLVATVLCFVAVVASATSGNATHQDLRSAAAIGLTWGIFGVGAVFASMITFRDNYKSLWAIAATALLWAAIAGVCFKFYVDFLVLSASA